MKREKDSGIHKPTTRRQFLKVAGIGGLSAASLYLLGCAAEAVTTTETVTTTVTGPGVTTTVTASGGTATTTVTAGPAEISWDYEADVVVCGSGGFGMISAIRARDLGASVIVVEANWDIGGKAINSGGYVTLGTGTPAQIAQGIVDSPDLTFKDITDWSIMSNAGISQQRHVDKEQARAWADNALATYHFLEDVCGVVWQEGEINWSNNGGGISVPKNQIAFLPGSEIQSAFSPTGAGGVALMRTLEASARAMGVQFIMNRHMDSIFRENPLSGRVLGVRASYSPTLHPDTGAQMTSYRSEGNINETSPNVNIKAKKAIFIATGSHKGNLNLRRSYNPGATEEVQIIANAWAPRLADGSGQIAAMDIGAGLWGNRLGYEHDFEFGKPGVLGVKFSQFYAIGPDSVIFPFVRATGLSMPGTAANWQNAITVNQVGKRFYDETRGGFAQMPFIGYLPPGVTDISQYVHQDWRNTEITYEQSQWVAASRQMNEFSEGPDYAAGPVWAIFDADAVTRMNWTIGYPWTSDTDYFFSGSTIAELAGKVTQNPYTKRPMPAANLEETVTRYNSFVDTGVDSDFDKPTPQYKIDTPPFYAAWFTPLLHDVYQGLRANGNFQVVDRHGNGDVIPSLYAGGETVGGLEGHGLIKGLCPGYIAGAKAVLEPSW